jgi:hypothetical protein
MSKNKGTLVQSTIRPISDKSQFPTAHANELLGGFHSVSTTTERDAISIERRQFGMLVYISSTDEFYQLKTANSLNLSDNLNWVLVPFGTAASTSEWVNSVRSRSTTPPAFPNVNDRYLVTVGLGAWLGYDDLIVEWDGSNWNPTIPSEGFAVKVDDESNSIYFYENSYYPYGTWNRKDFMVDQFELLWNIPSTTAINVGTNSEYLIFGNLNVDGVLDTWGKVIVLNGTISGTGSIGIYGSGSVQQYDLLTDIFGATGINVNSNSNYTKEISLDLLAGTNITLGTSGSSVVISSIGTSQEYNRYVIQPAETVTVPDYQEYWIYGDLTVYGTLDIGTYGKVVVANGSFVAATGSLVNNMGNVEVYDLLTVADDNLKVDITEIKYGTAGRVLFESELKYIPLMGTYARVLTESSSFVYSTSSAYSTSTSSIGLEKYLGVGTSDPLKKLHVRNSGILIDGIYPEQTLSLGDPNYARFVINTNTSNTETYLNFRHNLGTVLNVQGAIEGGNRYPSLSIGTTSTVGVLNIYDYSNNNLMSLSRLGSFSQTNLNTGFQILNKEYDAVFATISGAGAYYDDGVTVRFAGVADNSNVGGTFGSALSAIDRNTGIFNQVSVQSDYVYVSVWDLTNSIYNSLSIFTNSVVLSYIGSNTYDITLDDVGVKLTTIPSFDTNALAIAGGLTSSYLYKKTSGGVTTLCIVP